LNRRWLARQIPSGWRSDFTLKTDAFDEAAGEGAYPLLKQTARRVCLMDISPSVCRAARHRYEDVDALAGDVAHPAFAGGSFDLVVSLSTLDHLDSREDILGALRRIYAILRPGGRLLITLDNTGNPVVWIRNALPNRILRASGLVPYPIGVSLSPGRFRQALAEAGFEVQQLDIIMHIPRPLAVALADIVERSPWTAAKRWFCSALLAFECLSKLPTARCTGNYIAACCRKDIAAGASQV
jgi:SAM-dependent methyltransferase